MSDLASIRVSAAAGEALDGAQLAAWARARRHFDATREQEAVGDAVLHVIRQRDRLQHVLWVVSRSRSSDPAWLRNLASQGLSLETVSADRVQAVVDATSPGAARLAALRVSRPSVNASKWTPSPSSH